MVYNGYLSSSLLFHSVFHLGFVLEGFVLFFFVVGAFCLLYNLVKDGMGVFVLGGFVRWVLSWFFFVLVFFLSVLTCPTTH